MLQCIVDFSDCIRWVALMYHDRTLHGVLHTARNIYCTYMAILIANYG